MPQDMQELFGDGQGEYSVNDTITFMENGEELTGRIIAITPPGQTVRGRAHPLTYIVDAGRGIPSHVYTRQIVNR